VVSLANPAAAAAATAAMHDSELLGRLLTVREDREPHQKHPSVQEYGGGFGSNNGVRNGGSGGDQGGWWAPPTPPRPTGSGEARGWGVTAAPGGAGKSLDTNSGVGRRSSGLNGGRQCFVGNLAPQVQWRDLKDHFRLGLGDLKVGRAAVATHAGAGAGASKGFGTVRTNETTPPPLFLPRPPPLKSSTTSSTASSKNLPLSRLYFFSKIFFFWPSAIPCVALFLSQVRFASVADAQRAVAELHGSLLMGRALVVREDRMAT
jgi:hypothetical protein